MRVQFESTVGDFVEVAMRQWRRSQERERLWRRDPAIGGSITALLLYLVGRPPLERGLVLAAVGFLIGWIVYPRFLAARMRQGAERAMRDWFAGATTLLIQAEPLATGFWLAQGAAEMLFPWRDVAGAVDADSGIEISTRYDVLILVRSRAFHDEAQRSAFLVEVHEHLARGRQPAA